MSGDRRVLARFVERELEDRALDAQWLAIRDRIAARRTPWLALRDRLTARGVLWFVLGIGGSMLAAAIGTQASIESSGPGSRDRDQATIGPIEAPPRKHASDESARPGLAAPSAAEPLDRARDAGAESAAEQAATHP